MFRNILVSAGMVLAFLPPANAQGTAPGPKPTAAEIKQAVALALTPGIQARPAICLKEYVDWCKTTTPKKWCYLTYTLSQIDSTGRVDYSEGFLSYNVAKGILEHGSPIGFIWYQNDNRYPTTDPFRPAGTKAVLDINPTTCTASIWVGGLHTTTPPLQVNSRITCAFDTIKGCAYLITLKKASLDVAQ